MHSSGNSNNSWPLYGLRRLVAKDLLPTALSFFPVNSMNPKTDEKKEMEMFTDEIDILADFLESKKAMQNSKKDWENKKLSISRALFLAKQQEDNHKPKCHSSCERIRSEKAHQSKSCVSQVPLKLLINVNCQRAGLGISIAGGKGSLPYKENDEGIFISRVSKGGPAEKAGVHIGDRVLEVNGQDMQAVSHHEAVSALRSAGSCIKLKVLRQKPAENQTSFDVSNIANDPESVFFVNNIQTVICNSKGLSNLIKEAQPVKDKETFLKTCSQQSRQNWMMIPRIILTHPSTSDDDVEALTCGTDDELDSDDA